MNVVEGEHRPQIKAYGQIHCECGWVQRKTTPFSESGVHQYAQHFAVEEQAKKPRARRGGVDDSEPTSESHIATWHLLDDIEWSTAAYIFMKQDGEGRRYSPQRIRTCLAGLVRAGMAEERKVGKYREYRRRAFG